MISTTRRSIIGALVVGIFTAGLTALTAGNASAAHSYGDRLYRGETLGAGEYIQRLTLSGGNFTVIMQSDGNLVEYRNEAGKPRKVCWASGTQGRGGTYVVYQNDGNFVMYPTWSTTAVWSSGTYQGSGSTVDINKFGAIFVGTTQISSNCTVQ